MKRFICYMLCAFAVFSLSACGDKAGASGEPGSSAGSSNSTALSNPFVDCESLEEAVALAGFDMTAPAEIDSGYSQRLVRGMKNELIELIYKNDDGENQIRIRKAVGGGDISGDYNQYPETDTVALDSLQVTMKGADGAVNAATWTNGGYAYAITSSQGLSSDEIAKLVQAVS